MKRNRGKENEGKAQDRVQNRKTNERGPNLSQKQNCILQDSVHNQKQMTENGMKRHKGRVQCRVQNS